MNSRGTVPDSLAHRVTGLDVDNSNWRVCHRGEWPIRMSTALVSHRPGFKFMVFHLPGDNYGKISQPLCFLLYLSLKCRFKPSLQSF